MKKIILLSLLLIGFGQATEYRLIKLKEGGTLNVREVPIISSHTVVGKLPSNATGIRIERCKYNRRGREWCYIKYPLGSSHLEGWVSRYFLTPMKKDSRSKVHITNFLHNYYMADEENFLDKLQVFYTYPMQQYMYARNLALMELRNRKVTFYKKWPIRDYRLTYLKILKRKRRYIDVQATVRWNLKNREREESGKDVQKIRLIPSNGTFKVLAIKNLNHIVFPKVEEILAIQETEENLKENGSLEENVNSKKSKGGKEIVKKEIIKKEILNKEITKRENKKEFYIKVGSFVGTINNKYLKKISNNKLPYIIQKVKQGDNLIQRVLIGPFDSSAEAQALLQDVRNKININAYVQGVLR